MPNDLDFKCLVDKRGFDTAFREYLQWNKRQPAQLVNTKLYFVAAQACKLTRKATPEKIKNGLDRVASRTKRPNVDKLTIGELIALKQLRAKTKTGKLGKSKKFGFRQRLDNQVKKIIALRVSHIGFIVTGWKQAMAKLDFWNKKDPQDYAFSKRFAPRDALAVARKVKIFGHKIKGDITPARLDALRVKGTIFSFVGQEGKQATPRLHRLIQEGLNKAVSAELASMRLYIERKHREFADKLRSRNGLGLD